MMMPRALLLLTLETGTSSITTGREGVGNNFSYCKRPYILFLWDLSLFAIYYTMIHCAHNPERIFRFRERAM